MGKAKCLPISAENQAVIEVDVSDEHIACLHRTHSVDAINKTLIERPPTYEARPKSG
jgi:hypothetical protein